MLKKSILAAPILHFNKSCEFVVDSIKKEFTEVAQKPALIEKLIESIKKFVRKMEFAKIESANETFWIRQSFIEAIIGHMKIELALERNALKSKLCDRINMVVSASGYNFKKRLNILND